MDEYGVRLRAVGKLHQHLDIDVLFFLRSGNDYVSELAAARLKHKSENIFKRSALVGETEIFIEGFREDYRVVRNGLEDVGIEA